MKQSEEEREYSCGLSLKIFHSNETWKETLAIFLSRVSLQSLAWLLKPVMPVPESGKQR